MNEQEMIAKILMDIQQRSREKQHAIDALALAVANDPKFTKEGYVAIDGLQMSLSGLKEASDIVLKYRKA